MWKLFRYYNQNRGKVWLMVIVILFIILLIQTLSGIAKKENQTNVEAEQNSILSNEIDYTNQSQAMIEKDNVPEIYQQDFGDLVNSFLTYCKNHVPEKAYDLLTQECKDIFYPTLEIFEEQYYEPKFSTEKIFTFQSWTASKSYIYLAKIYDNMLATGRGNDKYIQDYLSVVEENGVYKLNVNGFIGSLQRNAKSEDEDVSITVKSSEMYMDYEIANIVVKNNCPYDIVLDTRENTNTVYLVNDNGAKFEAMLFENKESDLKVKANQEKTIRIKFSSPYQEGSLATEYVFSDVHGNENEVVKTIKVEV